MIKKLLINNYKLQKIIVITDLFQRWLTNNYWLIIIITIIILNNRLQKSITKELITAQLCPRNICRVIASKVRVTIEAQRVNISYRQSISWFVFSISERSPVLISFVIMIRFYVPIFYVPSLLDWFGTLCNIIIGLNQHLK